MPSFRTLRNSDLDHICSFPQTRQELFFISPRASYPLTVTAFSAILSERHHPTVALLDGQLAGFASLYNVNRENHCFVGNIIVNPEFRQRKLGTAIVAEMARIAQAEYAVKSLHLSCFSHNVRALLLYSGLGFQPYSIEERRDYTDSPVALVHMQKILS